MPEFFGREGKRPTVACDLVIFSRQKGKLRVLLVKRGKPPFKGMWALPGGFMEWDESCKECAARELKEETGIGCKNLKLLGVFSKPGRDPRGTIVSVSYTGILESAAPLSAGDDANEAEWFDAEKCPKLGFDHAEILKKALLELE